MYSDLYTELGTWKLSIKFCICGLKWCHIVVKLLWNMTERFVIFVPSLPHLTISRRVLHISQHCTGSWGAPQYLLRIFILWIMLQYGDHDTSLVQHLRWSSFWQKNGNCQEPLFIVVIESFVLNMKAPKVQLWNN